MKQCDCPAGRPGRVSARQPTYLFCFAKRRRREKATPEMAVRCADSPRRWHRNREASETRYAQTADASLSDFGTSDVAPSTGIHCNGNGNGNGNGRCAGKVNGNGRCAGKVNGNGRCAERANATKPIAMLTGVVYLTLRWGDASRIVRRPWAISIACL